MHLHLRGSGANLANFCRIASGILATLRVCRLIITQVLHSAKQALSPDESLPLFGGKEWQTVKNGHSQRVHLRVGCCILSQHVVASESVSQCRYMYRKETICLKQVWDMLSDGCRQYLVARPSTSPVWAFMMDHSRRAAIRPSAEKYVSIFTTSPLRLGG